MTTMIAVFLGPEALSDILACVQGDHNDQNIGDEVKEQYSEVIAEIIADCDLPGEVTETGDEGAVGQVFMCVCEGTNRQEGKVRAGYMGFERDYVREDSWHGVIFV